MYAIHRISFLLFLVLVLVLVLASEFVFLPIILTLVESLSNVGPGSGRVIGGENE